MDSKQSNQYPSLSFPFCSLHFWEPRLAQTPCLSAPWHLLCYRIPYGILLNSFQASCSFACNQVRTGPPLGLGLLAIYFTKIFSECCDTAGCLPWFPVWTQTFPYIYILLAIFMENLMPNAHLEICVSYISIKNVSSSHFISLIKNLLGLPNS